MGDMLAWILFFFILIGLIILVVYQLWKDLGEDCLIDYGVKYRESGSLLCTSLKNYAICLVFGINPSSDAFYTKGTDKFVLQLMCLSDLEFDYINPYDSASRINQVILPEFITEGVLCLLYLVTGHWIMSLLGVPYLYYNVRLYMQRQHLIDVTEIFNLLDQEKKRRLFKLGYLVVLLFLSLFWLIYSALEDVDE